MTDTKFHKIIISGGEGQLPSPPEHFNNPFDYNPHPLCLIAAEQTASFINNNNEWNTTLSKGKMLGVLVVEHQGQTGFLAAYSGQVDIADTTGFFVPPVFDYLQPDGHFKRHEAEISLINKKISELESNPERLQLFSDIQKAQADALHEIDAYRQVMYKSKATRNFLRQQNPSEEELLRLEHESQHEKATFVRIKQKWKKIQAELDAQMAENDLEIENLKHERQQRSEELQTWLFRHFIIRNCRGEERDLMDIFKYSPTGMPPSGSGECCAPKLLQYAFTHDMKPLCMAEFWWGESPKNIIRRHFNFYPSCRGKCFPILSFMLDGMMLENTNVRYRKVKDIEIIYEDESLLVVLKPAGLLSVPGKNDRLSLFSLLLERGYTPKVVHRLDMDTSGLLVVPLTVEAHHNLQRQFFNRTVKKRYVAIVEPMIGITLEEGDHGTIDLPLCPDPFDRPHQMIDYEYGKRAITEWRVVSPQPSYLGSGEVMLSLVPHTGRTHQLRVHCASSEGLASPIKGDPLYGHRAERMYLHAEYLEFSHPVTGKRMRFTSPPGF